MFVRASIGRLHSQEITGDRKRNYRVRECTCVRKNKCYKGVSGIDATGVGKWKWKLYCLSYTRGYRRYNGSQERKEGLKSRKLIGWLCLSPATSLVLQSAAILVSRPDQVNYLRDTTGEYGLHHVIEQNTTHSHQYTCVTGLIVEFTFASFFFLFLFYKYFVRLVGSNFSVIYRIFLMSCRDVLGR